MRNTQGSDSAPSSASNYVDIESLDIGRHFATLWRHKWQIALSVLFFALIGIYYLQAIAVPKYIATSVIVLDTQGSNITNLQSVVGEMGGETEQVNTELETLRSRNLMTQVVDNLNLVEDPEFNSELRDPGLVERIRTSLGMSEQVETFPEEVLARQRRDSVTTSLLRSVSVRNIPRSLVFQVSVESEDRLKAALIADTIAETYVQDQIVNKMEKTEDATSWLGERVVSFQDELTEAEVAASQFASSIDLIDEDVLRAREAQLKDLRDRIIVLQDDINESNALLERLSEAQDRSEIAAVLQTPQINNALRSIEDGTPGADESFDRLVQNRRQQLSQRQASLLDRYTALSASEAQLSDQVRRQNADLIELQQLEREVESLRQLYQYFLGRLQETRAQQGLQVADSRILSSAVIPNQPSSPNKKVFLLGFALFGFVVGAVIALVAETRQSGVRSGRDLELLTGHSVLGQIPKANIGKRSNYISYIAERPTSALVEALRNLRTSLSLMNRTQKPTQVLMVTSCVPGEGKTSTSLGLAANWANLGKKVLLIEGDIRRRTLSHYWPEIDQKAGITSVIRGETTLEDALYFDERLNLSILGGDESGENAADILASQAFQSLIDTVRAHFDLVVIDCPPVLVVPDARIVAQYSDANLFVVRWDSTSRYQIEEAIRMFNSAGQDIDGLVLTQIDMQRAQSYGGYGKYASYGAYGGQYYTK